MAGTCESTARLSITLKGPTASAARCTTARRSRSLFSVPPSTSRPSVDCTSKIAAGTTAGVDAVVVGSSVDGSSVDGSSVVGSSVVGSSVVGSSVVGTSVFVGATVVVVAGARAGAHDASVSMTRTPHTAAAVSAARAGSTSACGQRSTPSCPVNSALTTMPSRASARSTRSLRSACVRGTCTTTPTTYTASSARPPPSRTRRIERRCRASVGFVIEWHTRTL